MKIRYFDYFVLNKLLNKYYTGNKFLLPYTINKLSLLNKQILQNYIYTNFSNDLKYLNRVSYILLKFSIFIILFNFLDFKNINKRKMIFIYLLHFEYFLYLKSFFIFYLNLLKLNENIFYLTDSSLVGLNLSLSYNYMTSKDILSFLLLNKVRVILSLNSNMSNMLFNRLQEFDINIIVFKFKNLNSQFMFLNFLYYLKEYNFYVNTIKLI